MKIIKHKTLEIKLCICIGEHFVHILAVLAQMVACLPLVQQVRGLIPSGIVNFR